METTSWRHCARCCFRRPGRTPDEELERLERTKHPEDDTALTAFGAGWSGQKKNGQQPQRTLTPIDDNNSASEETTCAPVYLVQRPMRNLGIFQRRVARGKLTLRDVAKPAMPSQALAS